MMLHRQNELFGIPGEMLLSQKDFDQVYLFAQLSDIGHLPLGFSGNTGISENESQGLEAKEGKNEVAD